MKKYSVITLGESLIDFIPLTDLVSGKYKAAVGGAPLNVAIGLSRLLDHVAMITRVGNDPIGLEIIKTLRAAGVEDSLVQVDPGRHTPVSVILPKAADMERYIIYRENTADSNIDIHEIPRQIFSDTWLFHIGTLLSTTKQSEETTLNILQLAKKGGAKVSLDVNIRPGCWKDKNQMIHAARTLVDMADLVKCTKDELEILGINPGDYVHPDNPDKLFVITDGPNEACACWKGQTISRAVPKVHAVDVTGAGDAFLSAFLYQYVTYRMAGQELDTEKIGRCMALGVKAGSHAVQTYGTHESYPTRAELLG